MSETPGIEPAYLEKVLQAAYTPYADVITAAGDRDLQSIVEFAKQEAQVATIQAGDTYLSLLDTGLIEDVSLAWDMATVQHKYYDVMQNARGNGLPLAEQALSDVIADEHKHIIDAYKKIGWSTLAHYKANHSSPKATTEFPDEYPYYTDEKIEELYDCTPMDKHEFMRAGYDFAIKTPERQRTIAWNALGRMRRDSYTTVRRLPDGTPLLHAPVNFQNANLDPNIQEQTFLNSLRGLDIKSLIRVINNTEIAKQQMGDSGVNWYIGRNTTVKTLDIYKRVAASRLKAHNPVT